MLLQKIGSYYYHLYSQKVLYEKNNCTCYEFAYLGSINVTNSLIRLYYVCNIMFFYHIFTHFTLIALHHNYWYPTFEIVCI